MSRPQKSFAADYIDVATRIVDALGRLPVGRRGPKASRLRDSLTQDLGADECWPWQGRCGSNGYGIAVYPGERARGTSAHRLVFSLVFGEPPADWHVDHACHDPAVCRRGPECPHRRCVNPSHLVAMSARSNTLRGYGPSARNAAKVECVRGHAFTPENTYIDPRGRRACRECQRVHWRRYSAAKRGAA